MGGSVTEDPRHKHSHWLFLRLASAGLVLAASVVLFALAVDGAPIVPLVACVGLEIAITLVGGWLLRVGAPERRVQAAQLVADVVVIAAVVHFTGGLASRFHLLYFFPLFFGAYALEQKGALYIGGFAAAVNLGYTLLVAAQRIVPPHIAVREGIVANEDLISSHLVVTLLLVVGYLAGEVAGRIRRHERELSEKSTELANHQRETSTLVDNMGSGIITVDDEGRVQRVNPSAERILGMGASALKGTRISEGLADLMPVFVGAITECVADGEATDRMELHVQRPDDTTIPIGLSINPMTASDGRRVGAVAVFQDLSDVTRMREQVRQQDRLAAMGELSAVIAHEIRNPLASIRGSVEMLESELELEGEAEHLFALVRKESERLNRMIEDFLDYARLKHTQLRNCRCCELVDELRDLLSSREDLDAEARLVLLPGQQDLVVRADEEMMGQVFLNLALNAYQAMGDRGALTIAVGVRMEGRQPEVVFRFLDEGPGIEEESLPRIFEPFFTTRHHGTGLGLPLADRVVASHDGRIVARNLDGGGAEFCVHLPLVGIWQDGRLLGSRESLQQITRAVAEASSQEGSVASPPRVAGPKG
jgi:two-component system sensor histidine kinase PilS (NtrC family)